MIAALHIFLRIVRPLRPFIQKRAAGYAANYLNTRRQERLKRRQGAVEAAAVDPELLAALCAGQQLAEPPLGRESWPWMPLSSGLLGAAVGAALCLIFVKRR